MGPRGPPSALPAPTHAPAIATSVPLARAAVIAFGTRFAHHAVVPATRDNLPLSVSWGLRKARAETLRVELVPRTPTGTELFTSTTIRHHGTCHARIALWGIGLTERQGEISARRVHAPPRPPLIMRHSIIHTRTEDGAPLQLMYARGVIDL